MQPQAKKLHIVFDAPCLCNLLVTNQHPQPCGRHGDPTQLLALLLLHLLLLPLLCHDLHLLEPSPVWLDYWVGSYTPHFCTLSHISVQVLQGDNQRKIMWTNWNCYTVMKYCKGRNHIFHCFSWVKWNCSCVIKQESVLQCQTPSSSISFVS